MKRTKFPLYFLMGLGLAALISPVPGQSLPLTRAHAHNDYLHDRPLFDALEQGFCSVEADVFYLDGQFLVAHERPEVVPGRTLEGLYLEPLRNRVGENSGSVQPGAEDFFLWIDVKTDGEEAWPALRDLLLSYRDILSVAESDVLHRGPVSVIVSGNRAASLMLGDRVLPATIDGRFSDLNLGMSPRIMSWLSDDYSRYFTWSGDGEMPSSQLENLQEFVTAAHERGYRVRLWAIPDRASAWAVLEEAGVDLINTDDLKGLSRFLRDREKPD